MDQLTNIFKVLSDKTRLRILFLLHQAKKDLCICEIVDALQIAQYNISRHIKELKNAGLVRERRQGKFVFYCSAKPCCKAQERICRVIMASDKAFFAGDAQNLKKRLKLRVNGKCVVGSKRRYC